MGVKEQHEMKLFDLIRADDETGVSGTGIVAEGVQFSDGTAVLRWLSATPSTVAYEGPDGMHGVAVVHGHTGKTRIVWR